MFSPIVIAICSFAYIGLLFFIATRGDKHAASPSWQPFIYTLSISTVCTSWTFYGAIEQFSVTGWWVSPIHIGIILTFVFGWRFLQRLVDIARQENSTTIADFVAARYGHSRVVGVLVAVISLVGITPYVALQYKAVAVSFDILTEQKGIAANLDLAFIVAMLTAVFSIMFGTRSVDTSEKHHGLMHTLAFEAVFKVVLLVAVGLFVIFGLFSGPFDLLAKGLAVPEINKTLTQSNGAYIYISHILLGMTIIFALPRQFHVAVVENSSKRDLKTARWLFPLYLVAINILVQPIAIGGKLLLGLDHPDTAYFSLLIPMGQGLEFFTLLVYLGGISAATSMVIIATVTLSTMMSNELLLPFAFKLKLISSNNSKLNLQVLWTRRVGILIVSLGAYFYYRNFTSTGILVSIGMPALIAAAQFAPSIILGIGWDAMNRRGAILGLCVGFFTWFYTLVFPVIIKSGLLPIEWLGGPLGLDFLAPQGLFGMRFMDPTVHGMFWSLTLNTTCLVLGSFYSKESLVDRVQANRFVNHFKAEAPGHANPDLQVEVQDLRVMLIGVLGEQKTAQLLEDNQLPYTGRLVGRVANDKLISQAERMLGSAIGASAARVMLESLTKSKQHSLDKLSSLVEEAKQVSQFGRGLLNSAVQSISQGISIIDRDMNLVAWNRQFEELFDFPEHMLVVGHPIENLIRHNAEQGELGEGDIESLVQRRVAHLKSGSRHRNERLLRNGCYIEVVGNPMPEGNYITTYNDISDQKTTEKQLKQANESLEAQVYDRTQSLNHINHELSKANKNKTHYLAAVGHDLVQPLNSAELFSASLHEKLAQSGANEQNVHLVENIQKSIDSAGNLLSGLLEFSKIDSDLIKPEIKNFNLNHLLDSLLTEMTILAKQKGLNLDVRRRDLWVTSDPVLLKRIVQNLISNAIRYTKNGTVLVAFRRNNGQVCIEIWDTGVGIPGHDQKVIFQEFKRLANGQKSDGLGLGLAIVSRLCDLLGHRIEVRSKYGSGSVFKVSVLQAKAGSDQAATETAKVIAQSQNLNILCIDNEPDILDGMKSLLEQWGYRVAIAIDEQEGLDAYPNAGPDLVLIDYHLDQGVTGISVINSLRNHWNRNVPAALITANYTEQVSEEAKMNDLVLLKKPIKPLALRSVIENQLLIKKMRND